MNERFIQIQENRSLLRESRLDTFSATLSPTLLRRRAATKTRPVNDSAEDLPASKKPKRVGTAEVEVVIASDYSTSVTTMIVAEGNIEIPVVSGEVITASEAAEQEENNIDSNEALYLREIRRRRLLTAEEEVKLAKELEAGVIASEILKNPEGLTPEEIEEYEEKAWVGSEARRVLTEHNLRLVASVARKYMGRGMSLLDLVQEGSLGLSRAVEKFDYRRGFKFSTYAVWWIRQRISRAVKEQSRTIRLPDEVTEFLSHVYAVSIELQHELGRRPTPKEIGEKMERDESAIEEAFRLYPGPLSLEMELDDGINATLGDLVRDPKSSAQYEEVDDRLDDEIFSDIVKVSIAERLTDDEMEVIRLMYGIGGGEALNQTRVGVEMGIHRNKVKSLATSAIEKLQRDPSFRRVIMEAR